MGCASLVGTGNFYQPWSAANPNWDFEVQLVKLNSIGKCEDKAPIEWYVRNYWCECNPMINTSYCQALQAWIWSWRRKLMLTHCINQLYFTCKLQSISLSFFIHFWFFTALWPPSLVCIEAPSHPRQAVQVAPGAPAPPWAPVRTWRHGCNGRCRRSRRSSQSCASGETMSLEQAVLRCLNSQGRHYLITCCDFDC